jgi:hypothetical protein
LTLDKTAPKTLDPSGVNASIHAEMGTKWRQNFRTMLSAHESRAKRVSAVDKLFLLGNAVPLSVEIAGGDLVLLQVLSPVGNLVLSGVKVAVSRPQRSI